MTPTPIEIRPATGDDAEAVGRLAAEFHGFVAEAERVMHPFRPGRPRRIRIATIFR